MIKIVIIIFWSVVYLIWSIYSVRDIIREYKFKKSLDSYSMTLSDWTIAWIVFNVLAIIALSFIGLMP